MKTLIFECISFLPLVNLKWQATVFLNVTILLLYAGKSFHLRKQIMSNRYNHFPRCFQILNRSAMPDNKTNTIFRRINAKTAQNNVCHCLIFNHHRIIMHISRIARLCDPIRQHHAALSRSHALSD